MRRDAVLFGHQGINVVGEAAGKFVGFPEFLVAGLGVAEAWKTGNDRYTRGTNQE